jgi:predicted O-methyltransferase YrrM
MPKSLLPPAIADYIHSRFTPESPLQQKLRARTASLPNAHMLTDPDQAAFLSLLTRISRAKNALEIGTFTGYSALAIASALPPDGRLTCLDLDPVPTAIAAEFWKEARLADKITLLLAPAADTLRAFHAHSPRPIFDFVFIDADKEAYDTYFELTLPLLPPGAPILFDNMIRPGIVEGAPVDAAAKAIAALNQKLAADPRIHASLLPLGPGMVLATKR